MSRSRLLFAFMILTAVGARAQNARSAVSVNGNDANPCTVALPCRSFSAAIAVTNASGEIVALDSAGYGPFTISNSVTVSGAPGVHAAITSAAGNGITVNGGAVSVAIRHLTFIGTPTANAGINVAFAQNVYVSDCVFRDFPTGINIIGTDTTVERCTILGANVVGIYGQTIQTVILDTLIEDSDAPGLYVSGHAQVTLVACTIARVNTGIYVEGTVGSGLSGVVNAKDCVIVRNTFGVWTNSISGNTAFLYMSRCMINHNTTAVTVQGVGAAVYTYGDNMFNHNGSAGDAMTGMSFQ